MSHESTAVSTETPAYPHLGEHGPMVDALVRSALDVFATMVALPLVAGVPTISDARPPANVIGTVGFAGSISGLVSFCGTRVASLEITAALLGSSVDAVAGDLPDAIGEVANMIAGSFRTKMSHSEDRWAITMPVVTIGEDFLQKYSSSAVRVICPLTMGTHQLFVELVLQPA
ncbi:MAG: chemotaxis protein CheX [Acidobacteria bacterium]|nr:chemotaxis protein CheX [Acidobacteriota bacterium]